MLFLVVNIYVTIPVTASNRGRSIYLTNLLGMFVF